MLLPLGGWSCGCVKDNSRQSSNEERKISGEMIHRIFRLGRLGKERLAKDGIKRWRMKVTRMHGDEGDRTSTLQPELSSAPLLVSFPPSLFFLTFLWCFLSPPLLLLRCLRLIWGSLHSHRASLHKYIPSIAIARRCWWRLRRPV